MQWRHPAIEMARAGKMLKIVLVADP